MTVARWAIPAACVGPVGGVAREQRGAGLVHDVGWSEDLTAYAERLHAAAGPGHHVVSALGVWMLVALCAPLADDGACTELVEVLGTEPMEAAQSAATVSERPHPLVGAGVGMWIVPAVSTPVVEEWQGELPGRRGSVRHDSSHQSLLGCLLRGGRCGGPGSESLGHKAPAGPAHSPSWLPPPPVHR
jgi:hypothetical protein